MKKYISLFAFLFITFSIYAQKPDSTQSKVDSVQAKINVLKAAKDSIKAADTLRYWKKGGLMGINFMQSSFTNWAAGGENALSATALVSLYANYKKDKSTWDNNLDMAYGILQSGTTAVRKNEDKIEFSSKYGRYAFADHWYYTALLSFKSQFDNGYNYPDDSTIVSHFLAPAYVLGAIGLDYKTKNNTFSFFVSPLTSKTTIVNDQRLANEGAFGVDKAEMDTVNGQYVVVKKGKLVRNEFGGYIRIAFNKEVIKNVTVTTKVELFSNYLKNPQNVDVNWELLIGMKVNKFITASISTQMIYDDDIPVAVQKTDANGVKYMTTGPRLQFKEVLAVGLSYKF